MKKLLRFVLFLTLLSASVSVSTTQTVTDCQALIDQTAAGLVGVTMSGNNAE